MKRIAAVLLTLTLLAGITTALSAGTADDPLLSLSFIQDTFTPEFLAEIKADAERAFAPAVTDAETKLDQAVSGYILTAPGYSFASGYKPISAVAGAVLKLAPGTNAVVSNGVARLTVTSGDVINLSTGAVIGSETVISASNRLFTAENAAAELTVYSDTALLLVDGSYRFTQGSGTAPGILFTDIPDDYWAKEHIYALAEKKLVNGTGNMRFEPEITMTRGMFVTLIGRLSGISVDSYTASPFTDVNINEYYGPYVAWASKNNIVSGNGDGTFSPDDPITREQMAVIVVRYANYAGIPLSNANPAIEFKDAALIDDWAVDSVAAAQRAGLINGKTGGVFDPLGTAIRAEVCALIYRLIS